MKPVTVLLMVALAACSKEAGKEKGPCYGNGTCDEGLECLSETCVAPKDSPGVVDDVEVAPKYSPGALGDTEKLVDEVCACKDQACVEEVASRADRNQLEKLEAEAPEKALALSDRAEACFKRWKTGSGPKSGGDRRTIEAQQFVKKLSDAARTYYSTPSFPGTATESFSLEGVGPSPPLGECCKNGGQCKPSAETWDHPTWRALDFSMKQPHYFSYEFKRTKNGSEDSYTAIAYGDLDCDGKYSTFTLTGMIVDGEVRSAREIVQENPLE